MKCWTVQVYREQNWWPAFKSTVFYPSILWNSGNILFLQQLASLLTQRALFLPLNKSLYWTWCTENREQVFVRFIWDKKNKQTAVPLSGVIAPLWPKLIQYNGCSQQSQVPNSVTCVMMVRRSASASPLLPKCPLTVYGAAVSFVVTSPWLRPLMTQRPMWSCH